MLERRFYTRYDVSGSVVIKSVNNTPKSMTVELINIGFKGMGIFFKEIILFDSCVDFEVKIDTLDRRFAGTGRIKNIKEKKIRETAGFIMGIEFIEVPKDEVVTIVNLIQNRICADIKDRNRFNNPQL
ncbi:MAG: PilZ domain-containing protein [Candidatus Omnitrophota bacterium]